jgi:hypothetical protein
MSELPCPGCGESVSLNGLRLDDKIDCSNCANLTLRLKETGGKYFLEEIPMASCPSCDRLIEVPEGRTAGDTMECCGEKYVLTYEFGTYSLITQNRF